MEELHAHLNNLKDRLESLAEVYFGPHFCDEIKDFSIRHPFVSLACAVIATFSAVPVACFLCFVAVTVFISVICFIFIGGSVIVCGGFVLIGIVSFITFITVCFTSSVAVAYWIAHKAHKTMCGRPSPREHPTNDLSAETRNQPNSPAAHSSTQRNQNVTPDSSTGGDTPGEAAENYEVIG